MAQKSQIKGVFKIDDMAKQIVSTMREYGNVTREEVDHISEQVAKRGAMRLRTAGEFVNRRGDYRRGWRAKKLETGKWVVHNATDYRLTHLLEKGHEMDNSDNDAKPYPHIKDVELEIIQQFEREIREALGG